MANELSVSAPGKVILLGEYACLDGGHAIVDALSPHFEMKATLVGGDKPHLPEGVHPASPAGVFFLKHSSKLKGWDFQWNDPYLSKYGKLLGVGSSSAQFVCAYNLVHEILGDPDSQIGLQSALDEYWKITAPSVFVGGGLKPSGVDVAMQFLGKTVFVRTNPELSVAEMSTELWSDDISRVLIFTGNKINTHEHLEVLKARGFPEKFSEMNKNLEEITSVGFGAMKSKNLGTLIDCFNKYQNILFNNAIGDKSFNELIEKVKSIDGILACKGAGAQNGDCLVALVKKKSIPNISEKLISLLELPVLIY